jgi:hypothetical protein
MYFFLPSSSLLPLCRLFLAHLALLQGPRLLAAAVRAAARTQRQRKGAERPGRKKIGKKLEEEVSREEGKKGRREEGKKEEVSREEGKKGRREGGGKEEGLTLGNEDASYAFLPSPCLPALPGRLVTIQHPSMTLLPHRHPSNRLVLRCAQVQICAFEAINDLVRSAPADTLELVTQLIQVCVGEGGGEQGEVGR